MAELVQNYVPCAHDKAHMLANNKPITLEFIRTRLTYWELSFLVDDLHRLLQPGGVSHVFGLCYHLDLTHNKDKGVVMRRIWATWPHCLGNPCSPVETYEDYMDFNTENPYASRWEGWRGMLRADLVKHSIAVLRPLLEEYSQS